MIIKDKDETLSYIQDATADEKRFIAKQLTFWLEGYKFMPSFRAGFIDGKKRFFKVHKDVLFIPKGLTNLVCKALDTENIPYVYERSLVSVDLSFNNFTQCVRSLNIPFEPYDYQLQAAYDSIINQRQINLMATGSGKSLTIYLLVRWFEQHNIKAVIVVPGISLVQQLYSHSEDYGWRETADFVHKIGGENKVKHFDKPVTITTWQSIYKSTELFINVGALIIDEVHTSKAASFEQIIIPSTPNTVYKVGFTGTLPKSLVDKMTILSGLGMDVRYISTKQLIDRGLATPTLIKPIFLEYPEEERKYVLTLKYQDEVKYFSEHPKRNIILSKMINKASSSGNVIVLFDRKEHGKELCLNLFRIKFPDVPVTDTLIKELMKPDNPYEMFYIVGESKAMDREHIRKLLEIQSNRVVFGTSSILSTGINIKNLHSLFLVSGGKSAIKLHQSIARLLRTHISKSVVHIWDIVDDCTIKTIKTLRKNYFYKHFEERLQEYLEAEHPLEEKSIKL